MLIALVLRSVTKKSPRALIRFFFVPILITFLSGTALQSFANISEYTNRQLLMTLILFVWCLKSIVSYRSIKTVLLSNFLDDLKEEIRNKNFIKIIYLILKVSFIQLACFTALLSLNYLTGSVHLNYIDVIGLIIIISGLLMECLCEKELKKYSENKSKLVESGPWSLSRNPNFIGIFLFFLGIQIIALNAVSNLWSIFGFLLMSFIIFKYLVPLKEKSLMAKFSNYGVYSKRVPKLISFKF